ncbi:MAG: RHS repeat-associated core domain-containing protein, partial [Bacteroidales bacterium]|nr:RHS repeat-associated core domain-containing protein [Bacteroidales bacterium]
MNRLPTYRPQTAQIPADPLRGGPCDTCDPRRFPRDPWRHSPPAHPILNSSFLILNWTYTFSAKEKDSETGLSYFGSRYYSSDLSIWLSVDPMRDKYPSLSPYVYCADNPVKLVDPDGEDIWEINEEGRIINHDKSFTEKDIVYRVDNNGNRIEGEVVAFDYG